MKKNVMWNTVGTVFYFFCQWILTVIVARILGYEIEGYFTLAMTMSSSYSTVALFNMRSYQASDVNYEFKDGTYKGSRVLTCIVSCIACFIAALISHNSIFQVLCIMVFMGIRVIEAWVDVLHGMNQRYERYDLIGISYLLRGFFTIFPFIIGLKLTNNLLIGLILVLVCNTVVAIVFDNVQVKKISNSFSVDISKETIVLLVKCAPYVVISFLLSQENLLPKQVLQDIYGAEQQGIYSAMASPALIIQVCSAVVFSPFLPVFSRVYQDENKKLFKNMIGKLYVSLIAMSVIVTIGAFILGKWGLSFLYGKEILKDYNIFIPIVWVTILTAVTWIFVAIITAMRKMKTLLIGMLADFIICLTFMNPCVQKYEKNGVSIIQIIALGLYVIYMIVVCELSARNIDTLEKA